MPPAALAGADPDLVHGGWLVILAGIKAHATPKRRAVAAADPHDANGVGFWVVGSGDNDWHRLANEFEFGHCWIWVWVLDFC